MDQCHHHGSGLISKEWFSYGKVSLVVRYPLSRPLFVLSALDGATKRPLPDVALSSSTSQLPELRASTFLFMAIAQSAVVCYSSTKQTKTP